MPARLIREGILTSERVDELDAPAEVFYRRLMSKVDDHGLYDARPAILRASLYPLRLDRVREADITRWIAACEKAGLIALYTYESKTYLQMLDTRWSARSEPKYPLPPTGSSKQQTAVENSCKQVKTPVDLDGGGDGDVVVTSTSLLGARDKFRMFIGWKQSDHMETTAKQAMVQITPEILQEFITYWAGQETTARTQAQWDNALLKAALHQKAKTAGKPPGSSAKPRKGGNIHDERAATIANLTGAGREDAAAGGSTTVEGSATVLG